MLHCIMKSTGSKNANNELTKHVELQNSSIQLQKSRIQLVLMPSPYMHSLRQFQIFTWNTLYIYLLYCLGPQISERFSNHVISRTVVDYKQWLIVSISQKNSETIILVYTCSNPRKFFFFHRDFRCYEIQCKLCSNVYVERLIKV